MENRLNNLMTYTTFHIGVYISCIGIFIGAGFNEDININTCLLQYSVTMILFAGIFGGTIGSNIPEVKTYQELADKRFLKIYSFILMPKLKICIHLEHFFFWAGVIPFALLFIIYGKSGLQ